MHDRRREKCRELAGPGDEKQETRPSWLALLKRYNDPDSPETLKSLNALRVRRVFCLYAEDAGIFGRRVLFRDYVAGSI